MPEPDASAGPAAAASPEPLLELRGVRAGYGAIEVLHGVDLALRPGSLLALLGPNGGGKSTTMRVCAGLHPPTGGDLLFAGRRVNGVSAQDAARLGVCAIPEGRGIFPNLTVRENLWAATGTGARLEDLEERAYARFSILGERRHQLAGSLSGGEQQMLALSRALGSDPAVLLLDELSMGLAPMIVTRMYETVAELVEGGLSVLVAEQFARAVLPIADTAALMLHGRVVAAGPPAEIEDRLSSDYLGG
ncbi:branched-chain amino acid transport system ATP-binding protein [Actinomadura coerulea]|uniref:Branched-chain amino acid transport system ATP-binding protein n=1 Tax=Actinomadura coerulea TaxID=46159 RepID=A0A7X0G0E7_9ACTN|nr:ABC transporter ATP-binding protein [Actinomadura coerulea]MBB6397107.1 branched-chain amino acid transport system ATP-binding protein [Actinomadura coerulea]GGP96652.1 ABC transporter ATP-binding protein [Actinomadura coerulea]